MMDVISAIIMLPALCLCFYAVERVVNHYVQKNKRKEKMRIIRSKRKELAIELAKCA